MKLEIKKIFLGIAAGICILSSAFGVDEGEMNKLSKPKGQKSEVSRIKVLPKFKKIRIINEVPEYRAEVHIEESKGEKVAAEKADFVPGANPIVLVSFEGEGTTVVKLRIILKDREGKKIESETKTIDWSSEEGGKIEISNILGDQLNGINVILAKDPSNESILVITIQEDKGQKKS